MNMAVVTHITWMYIALGLIAGVSSARYARCIFDGTTGVKSDPKIARPVMGTVIFSPLSKGVEVDVSLSGFKAEDVGFRHGFHIHMGNGTGNECKDAQGHLNPLGVTHGHPRDKIRHVGDMGNVEVIPTHHGAGMISTIFVDPVIRLDDSDHSIFNRIIQLHAYEDDYGRTNATDSPTSGNSGPRQACCKIVEITAEEAGASSDAITLAVSNMWILLAGALMLAARSL